ncbi:hypothetical protein LZ575_12330 [Antarcticibacterium sp. 1MA-6-2]|uniref:hypothetical protein n=1 Tax=Antarcticibacterium sp. 1MA-6-2 TaxID=2908210 RepID=UPI001F205CD8|nr:hypothetical protein [Antarcticibacterium sp. 1MA-6-2]UJH89805.1 hypothetical protein LZ575_12330 [Antarcticibacterium sp. 1MA-6-2]
MQLLHLANAAGFYSFTYSDYKKLDFNWAKIDSTRQKISDNHLLTFTREAGLIFTAEEPVLVLTTTDPVLAREAITSENELLEEFRNFSIFHFTEEVSIAENLKPLIKEKEANYFASVDEFILFSKNLSPLKNIITNYLNKTTLSEQESYKDATINLAESSSLLMVANSGEFKSKLLQVATPTILSEIEKLDFKNYPVLALQFVAESDFAHVHGVFNTTKATASASGPQQLAAIEIENTNIALKPFLLKNDKSRKIEVAFQDENNMLYLYSAYGEASVEKRSGWQDPGRNSPGRPV